MDIKKEILELLHQHNIDIDEELDKLGFFTSPASSNKHLSIYGGLAIHSYNVYLALKNLNEDYQLGFDDRFIVITSLLHDICKCDGYEPNILKNGSISDSKPYVYKDSFPIGHGEKSVIMLLSMNVKLTNEEMLAIRYHLGNFTFETISQWNMTKDLLKKAGYLKPVMALHIADMTASQILEEDDIYYKLYSK